MTSTTTPSRYDRPALLQAVRQLFQHAGLDDDKAGVVAEILIEGDLMGHATHGLALAPMYLEALRTGGMTREGGPEVVADRGACITWHGRRLPGPWLVTQAVDLALARVETYGTVTVALADSHHIGALATYLERATRRGCMITIASSVPSVQGVAPYGGLRGVFSPNPLAVGIPTGAAPILIDVSASITTLNMSRQYASQGRRFPQPWALDTEGQPTDDPNAVVSGGGTLLPAGGLDHGQKGYGWALMVEALSQGIAGFGRADAPKGVSLSVFIQVMDPDAFGGKEQFNRQMDWLADACRATPPLPGKDGVRLPGERAAALRAQAQREGVPLAPPIVQGLQPWAEAYGVALPPALQTPAA